MKMVQLYEVGSTGLERGMVYLDYEKIIALRQVRVGTTEPRMKVTELIMGGSTDEIYVLDTPTQIGVALINGGGLL